MTERPEPIPKMQLVLFIDDRPSAWELVQAVQAFLAADTEHPSTLRVVRVGEQPQLAEHFRVMLTPTLVHIAGGTRHLIAGKNLLAELRNAWSTWKRLAHGADPIAGPLPTTEAQLQIADEVFRLKQENAKLTERLLFQERMLAIVAHDLRNPLAAVSLAVETLEVSGDRLVPEKGQELLRHARQQVKLLDSLITDMLEAGAPDRMPQLVRVDLGKLCREALADLSLQAAIAAKKQVLTSDIPPDLPTIFGDPEQLRLVFSNLLDNASKYTPVGGHIALRVLHRTMHKVDVTVTDTGPGIPADLRERIFEHSYRLQPEDSVGYGIGLATCQRLVRAHYGRIWVDSAGKQGSCFHVVLPIF
ncbi:MAG TPA: histidine kinase [Cyanobacteria bacterium UBA8156]|jgi:two-component system clock-associated histidine kinase SasA|nr:histidine kinase [Cyanobacteria bacterium UBA8156]